ncbi:MAG: protein-export rane protein SecF, preprotein translocase subunit SecF [Patescibacteria group bacterium]|nr:protein-export rane protein SecF, preprotein translocase subunit SecF [Patescibacteria group bacterium]
MFIIRNKAIFFAIAIILVGGSIVTMIVRGFNVGVDFTGGSMLEVAYDTRPSVDAIKARIAPIETGVEVINSGDTDVMIRTKPIDETMKGEILSALSFDSYHATEKQFNTIGPSVGKELRSKAILSVILVSLIIILFIAFAFRKVAKPISSWTYGLIAIVVLVHDVAIPAGFFSLLHLQVDTLFVVGLLTILGVSINDTIVVFDRIRENLALHESKHTNEDFAHIIGKSVKQTFVRSIMTSLTVLIALAALYLFGPEATHTLAIAMFLGMFFGTYSSIFLAAPLLVVWNNYKVRSRQKKENAKKA